MQKRPRFLLVGYGNIGQRHALQMQRTGKLLACVDSNADRAALAAETFGCRAFTDLRSALTCHGDFDVAAICTPNFLHAPQSIECLNAELHVLCEKPMAISSADATAMLQAAGAARRSLWVVKQNRFNPPVQAVKRLLDRKETGRLLSVQINCFWNRSEAYYHNSWKGSQAEDGGTLYTQFSHFIDLLLWLCGPVEEVISATGANLQHGGIIGFEDTGLVQMRLANGALAGMHYSVNSFGHNAEGSITLLYEKATFKIGGPYLNRLDYALLPGGQQLTVPEGNGPNLYPQGYQGTMSNHPLVYDNLVAVIDGREKAHAEGVEGKATVDLIEQIYHHMKPRS